MRIFHEALEKARFRGVVKKSGFWYVDIPRTGSTAIRENLFEEFGWPHGKTRTDCLKHKRMHLPAHTPAQTARSEIGLGLWKELFSFAFVRNPYERFASLFFHFLRCEKRFNWDFETFVKELTKFTPITDVANKPFYAYRQVD